MREKKRLENVLSTDADLARRSEDIAAYFELAKEGENVDADLQREISALRELLDKLETETLLSGENDARNAIVTIHPGAGGTESQDWADMLLRMYLRWAERRGFETVLYDYQPGEEAGLKSANMRSDFCRAKSVYTGWFAFRPSIRPSAAIPRLPAFTCLRKLTTASRSSLSLKIFAQTPTAPAARAAST
jgi:protein subunit release factor A